MILVSELWAFIGLLNFDYHSKGYYGKIFDIFGSAHFLSVLNLQVCGVCKLQHDTNKTLAKSDIQWFVWKSEPQNMKKTFALHLG